MTEIQGKSILVQVSVRFELARVQVIGSQLYCERFKNKCNTVKPPIKATSTQWPPLYYGALFVLADSPCQNNLSIMASFLKNWWKSQEWSYNLICMAPGWLIPAIVCWLCSIYTTEVNIKCTAYNNYNERLWTLLVLGFGFLFLGFLL